MAEKKEFWEKKNPKEKSKKLTPEQKAKAKRRAKENGRPYPNMVDNAWASKEGSVDIEDSSMKSLAYGELTAPENVDTLRLKDCPVCGEDDSWDSDGRCRVCGHIPPPEPFQEPNLDIAQKADMRSGPINPNLFKSPAFEEEEEEEDEDDEEEVGGNTVNATLNPRKTQKFYRRQQGERSMRHTASTNKMRSIIQAQANQIAELQGQNDSLRRRLAVANRRSAQLRRRADIDNPAQPWAEGAEEAPAATTEGTIPSAQNSDVDVTTPGGWQDAPEAMSVDVTEAGGVSMAEPAVDQDVTAPVAGGVDHAIEDLRTEVDVNADGEGMGEVAYADGEWATDATTASKRTFASLRLARLRIEAGIDSGDDITLAEKIAKSNVTTAQIRNEISTLSKVQSVSASRRTASRPQANVVRNVPSLVSTAAPVVHVPAPSISPNNDEFLFI